ncbi:MAG TPA: fasciclin domain-containing protein [Phycisphaerales bacterium]|nr:fasciclin domain-containing protein [Phycisphaerales bacterium]
MKACMVMVAGVSAALVAPVFGQCESTESAPTVMLAAHEQPAGKKDAKAADIVDTAVAAGSFKTLVAAVKAAGLAEALKGKGPFTVFAPTDEAFAKLPKGTLESLLKPENKDKLAAILKYHVVPAKVLAADVKPMGADTLNGQRIDVTVKEGKVSVDKANVIATDVVCTNGVIHVIDSVILPSDKNIVETAAAAGSFTTLASLLEKAGLVDALKGEGPFTVFAPTDEAFAKLPKETVESLLKPENKDKLAAILKYHVVSGRVFSDAAAKGANVATLQGQKVQTKGKDGKVTVEGATVTAADIDASNGVIHVIDTVILPK